MPSDPPLIEKLRRTNRQRTLLPPGARVLVAVSGGPDSLALLHALCALRNELQIELVAAHLDHRMRGGEGEADARFVQETAAAWGVPAEIGSCDVPRLARRTKLSLEEAGRAARYRFFKRAARRAGCAVIATAHTADDRLETTLLHLFRGSGLDGLAGFPACRSLDPCGDGMQVIRPLIDVTRAEVLEYCRLTGLLPRHDRTNESLGFLRNRLRLELLPLLEAQYSPEIRRHLLRLARLAEEETAFLDEQAAELLARAEGAEADSLTTETPRNRGAAAVSSLCLSLAILLAAPSVLARRALRLAVQQLQPGPPPELATVERLLSLTYGQLPGFLLPGGRIRVCVTGTELIFEQVTPSAMPPPAMVVALAIPGTTPLPWAGGKMEAETVSAEDWRWDAGGRPLLLLPSGESSTQSPGPSGRVAVTLTPNEALLDSDRLEGPLTVRSYRPGDRIQPLGMPGHRKLHDLFIDRKVPRPSRQRVPLVCDARQIVWVAGCCMSDAVKVTAPTRHGLWLRWRPGSL